ncbi:MAG: MATE family efflux transporter [Gammaproteobacteria bacterium]|nr:MATE family efflux transporter [Gammaproteobacteria bacterium]
MRPASTSLTTGSIPRTLFAFALPLLMGNVLQSVNGSINAVWVGKFLGTAALTATNNSNIVTFLLLGGVFGLTMASTILIAQAVGGRRMEEAKRVVGTSATFFMSLAVLLAITGVAFSPHVLAWMATPHDALPLAIAYMRVMFLALPASYAFFFINAALRGAGDSKTPFYYLVLSVVLDFVLNPVFIFGVGPIPALGIAGSATATLVSQVVSLLALVRHVYRRPNVLALRRGEFHLLWIDWKIVRTLVLKGIPMGLQMIVLSSSMVLFLQVVNRFGSETAAAFAASMQLWNYVQMPAFALGAAVSSMVAQNIGAGLWDRVGQTARYGVVFNVAFTGFAVLVIYLASRHAIGVFLPPGSASVGIAEHINHIVLWSFPLFGISMVLSGVVRAAGAVVVPLLVLVIALLGVRVPLAFFAVGRWGADGVWWSFSISAAVAAVLTVAYYRYGNWRAARMAPTAAPAG